MILIDRISAYHYGILLIAVEHDIAASGYKITSEEFGELSFTAIRTEPGEFSPPTQFRCSLERLATAAMMTPCSRHDTSARTTTA
jgi:hypothetical protein